MVDLRKCFAVEWGYFLPFYFQEGSGGQQKADKRRSWPVVGGFKPETSTFKRRDFIRWATAGQGESWSEILLNRWLSSQMSENGILILSCIISEPSESAAVFAVKMNVPI